MFREGIESSVFYVVRIARVSATVLTPDGAVQAVVPPSHEGETSLNGKLPNAWLFQSNPVLYDLRGALRSLQEQVWSVSRYAKEIRTGDRVYLWEAGRLGGIAGIAEVIKPASLLAEPPEQLPFARDPDAFAGDRMRARLKIVKVMKPVVARPIILAHPELKTLGVLRCSRGTNFRLSPEEVKALDFLMEPTAAVA